MKIHTSAGRTLTLRRKRQKVTFQPHPVRLLFGAVAVALLGGAAAYMLFLLGGKVARPYLMTHKTAQTKAQIGSLLRAQQTKNAQLQARLAFLQSDEGAESMARRLGYHREGETVYMLQPGRENNTIGR